MNRRGLFALFAGLGAVAATGGVAAAQDFAVGPPFDFKDGSAKFEGARIRDLSTLRIEAGEVLLPPDQWMVSLTKDGRALVSATAKDDWHVWHPVDLKPAYPIAGAEYFGRVSCETGDPGEREYGLICARGLRPVAYLDGVRQPYVTTADSVRGWVKRHVANEYGDIAFNATTGDILTEVVHGNVRVVLEAAVR